MKKLLFVSKIKLDFSKSNSICIEYQDIIEGELLRLRTDNKGIDISYATELIKVTDEHLILTFWGEYK